MRCFLAGIMLAVPVALGCTWAGQLAENPRPKLLFAPDLQLINSLPVHG